MTSSYVIHTRHSRSIQRRTMHSWVGKSSLVDEIVEIGPRDAKERKAKIKKGREGKREDAEREKVQPQTMWRLISL